MTNYNERLDELEEQFLADYRNWNDGLWDYNGLDPKQKFHQAITSLTKELVAEAKPGNYTLKGHQPDACLNHEKYTSACCGCQRKRARLEALDQFEQNLLKELEER